MTIVENKVFRFSKPEYLDLVHDLLSKGHGVRVVMHGICMAPLIRKGDVMDILPVRPECICAGRVVLFRGAPDLAMVHRIISIGNDYLVTKGDHAITNDGHIPMSQVLGVVDRVHGGFADLHLHPPFCRILVMILGCQGPAARIARRLLGVMARLLPRAGG